MDSSLIDDLLQHPKIIETRDHVHHRVPKLDHLLRSARYSWRLAPLLRADRRVVLRAAILHDIDSREGTLATHGAIAARWAAAIGESEQVCRAIISHMYPIGPAPTTREGWVLVLADKLASLADLTSYLRGLFNGHSLRVQRRLHSTDPYLRQRRFRRQRSLRRSSRAR